MAGTPIPTLFFGGVDTDADILEFGAGFEDNIGNAIAVLALSDPLAPAGAAGECIFHNVYITMTWTMGVVITLTPVVDFVALTAEALTIDLGDVARFGGPFPLAERMSFRFEMGLSVPYDGDTADVSRQNMRGAWFQLQCSTVDLADGDLIFSEVELEYESVRESVTAETP